MNASEQNARAAPPGTARVRVSVDGSQVGSDRGYGIVGSDGRIDFGRLPGDVDAEIAAATIALTLYPQDVPLVIATDCSALLRVVRDGEPNAPRGGPRSRSTAREIDKVVAIAAARQAPVTFEKVSQAQRQEKDHAKAHLLAFLGRSDTKLGLRGLSNALTRIEESPAPDDEAHALVRAVLFPAGEDPGRVAALVPSEGGRPLSPEVEHYFEACSTHGTTVHARHRVGLRGGVQRYRDRCLVCHTTYNTAHRGSTTAPVATAVPAPLPVPLVEVSSVESVRGSDLTVGMVLPTGIVVDVTTDEDLLRVETAGADVHFVSHDEPVTVLAVVPVEMVNAISA